jgi:hypothetical protein
MAQQALFEGLVYDEQDNLVAVGRIGADAYYIVDDDGFHRHIDAETVDRQILAIFVEQLQEHKEIAVEQTLKMLGRDDLFTKAAIDASIRNVDINQIIAQGIPLQAREMMGMLGFRVVINVHGDLVRLDQPAASDDGEEFD